MALKKAGGEVVQVPTGNGTELEAKLGGVLERLSTDLDSKQPLVDALVVDSDEQAASANALGVQVRGLGKDLDTEESILTKPLKDHVKFISGRFKPSKDRVAGWLEQIRVKIAGYYDRKAAAERERAEMERGHDEVEAAERGLAVPATSTAPVPQPDKKFDGGGQVRQVWTFEVMDKMMVPREYMAVDTVAVNAAIKAGVRDVSGLRIFQQTQAVLK